METDDSTVVILSMGKASGVTIIANASGMQLPVESQLENPHYTHDKMIRVDATEDDDV